MRLSAAKVVLSLLDHLVNTRSVDARVAACRRQRRRRTDGRYKQKEERKTRERNTRDVRSEAVSAVFVVLFCALDSAAFVRRICELRREIGMITSYFDWLFRLIAVDDCRTVPRRFHVAFRIVRFVRIEKDSRGFERRRIESLKMIN